MVPKGVFEKFRCHSDLGIPVFWVSLPLRGGGGVLRKCLYGEASPRGPILSKGGAVVRALASHQCGPGSNPGVDAICGFSLLLVLPCSERFFSGYSGFSLSLKTNTLKFQFDLNARTRFNEFL